MANKNPFSDVYALGTLGRSKNDIKAPQPSVDDAYSTTTNHSNFAASAASVNSRTHLNPGATFESVKIHAQPDRVRNYERIVLIVIYALAIIVFWSGCFAKW
ncbi:hypothetical protein B9479_006933 [Cryptococcus floricola]|uniref:Uncharacterized protein n=1 Tax=Cryptococcus floricola TaxID=2591691 RepID=A0A5D3AP39_9TREE|nr:hypothetical protein B9479_006933 [Cryptococcus floricola]